MQKKSKEWPRVLVAAPTSIRHAYCIDEWVKSIRAWNYPKDRIEIIAVDNTPFEFDPHEEFYHHLLNLGIRVFRVPWDRSKLQVVRLLAACRELYRQIGYLERFDYIFNLDTDTTIEPSGLKTLISRNKPQIGLPVQVYPKENKNEKGERFQPPCVFKQAGTSPEKGLYYYTWKELAAIKKELKRKHKPLIYQVGAAPLGCLLVRKDVFEKLHFESHNTLLMGEDIWYHNNCDDEKIPFWIDFSVKVKHDNINWNAAQMKQKEYQQIILAYIPPNAKKAVWVSHGKRKRTGK